MDLAHVLVLAPEFWPHHTGLRGRAIYDLVQALASQGARLSVVTTTDGAKAMAPLARRLSTVQMLSPTSSAELPVYEGRGPGNAADVWAIASSDWPRVAPLALRLARDRAGPVQLVHGFDEACAGLLAVRGLPTVATLGAVPRPRGEAWAAAVESASAVVLPSREFARHPTAPWRAIVAGAKRLEGIVHGPGFARRLPGAFHHPIGLSRRYPLVVTHGPFEGRCVGDLGALAELPMAMIAVVPDDHPNRSALAQIAARRPRHLAIVSPDDDQASHARANAALHVFAAPYRPCLAHPLGTTGGIAVAHASGAFRDTVVSWDPSTRSGNGFLFDSGELVATLRLALAQLEDHRGPLERRARDMLAAAWPRAASRYRALYDQAMS